MTEAIDVDELGEADAGMWPLVHGDKAIIHAEECAGYDECSCEPIVVYGPSAFA